jgi:hypothetical protein
VEAKPIGGKAMSQVTFLGFVYEEGVIEVFCTEDDDVILVERAMKALKKFSEKPGVYEVIVKIGSCEVEIVDLDNVEESWKINVL